MEYYTKVTDTILNVTCRINAVNNIISCRGMTAGFQHSDKFKINLKLIKPGRRMWFDVL